VGVRFQAENDISGLEKLYKSNKKTFFLLEMLVTHNSRLKSAGKRRRSLLEKVLLSHLSPAIGEILRPPENSVPQTIVWATNKSGINCVGSIEKKVLFLSKYYLEINNTIASLFRTQYTPDFLIAEYYGLRNIIFCVTKDLASGFGTGSGQLLWIQNYYFYPDPDPICFWVLNPDPDPT
jgi:hypothetical protein